MISTKTAFTNLLFYTYKKDLVLNDLQMLIFYKTQPKTESVE